MSMRAWADTLHGEFTRLSNNNLDVEFVEATRAFGLELQHNDSY